MEDLKLQWQVTQSYSREIFVADYFSLRTQCQVPPLGGLHCGVLKRTTSSTSRSMVRTSEAPCEFGKSCVCYMSFYQNFRFFLRGGTYDTETLVSYLTAMGEMETKYLYLAGTERFRGRVRWEKNISGREQIRFFQVHSCWSKKGSPIKTPGASKQHHHLVSQSYQQHRW